MVGLLIGLAVTLTAAISLLIVCITIRDVLLDDLRTYLRRTVETAAGAIDGDLHALITDSSETGSPQYLALSAPLDILLRTNPDIRFAYTGIIRSDSMFYVLDGDRTVDRAYVMQPDEPTPGELEVSRTGRTVVETEPSPTAWGVGIRAYAPLRRGQVPGPTPYVGITMSATRYNSWVLRVYTTAALGFVVAVLLGVVAGLRATRAEETRLRAETEIAAAREMAAITMEHRRKMEHQVHSRHKMEALGTLAGGVAHDFNNLLAVILGNAEMLAAEAPPGSPGEESVSAIRTAARRARDVVRRILLYARPEAEDLAPIALEPVIEETIHLLETTLPSSISIHWQRPAEPVSAIADASQLGQVLMNLCVNASQALPDERGAIEFRLTQVEIDEAGALRLGVEPGPFALIAVRDTGAGMSEAVRARIFEPFFTTKTVGKGSGLGLSIVEGVVRGHRGAIEVESVERQGSTFSIYLPASAPAAAVPTKPSASPSAQPPEAGKRILLLDDEQMVLDVSAKVIRRAGYVVDPHLDVDTALAALEKDPKGYAALVTDRSMPKLSGLEVASRARALNRHLPVILVTGRVEAGDAEAGCIDAVVTKPADIQTLVGTIERAIADAQTVAARP